MADSLGFLGKAAFRKDRGLYGAGPVITYPQTPGAADLAATHMLPFDAESMGKAIERSQDVALVGAGRPEPTDIIKMTPAGSVGGSLRYQGWERLMLCAMGYENPQDSPVQLGVTSAYAHLFELDDTLQDETWRANELDGYTPTSTYDKKVRRGMLGLAKQVNDWVWQSVMVNKMTLSGNNDEVKINFDLAGYDLVKGAYNSANWTLPVGSTAQSLFQQAEVKIGPYGGGAGAMTIYEPSSFELVLDNKLKTDDFTTESGPNIIQPVRSDFREVSFKIEFPRYYTLLDLFQSLFDLDTEHMISIVLTGPQIGSTGYYYQWSFFLPLVVPKDIGQMPIAGSGPLQTTFEFDAHRPGTDKFIAGSYLGITNLKDSELIVMVQNSMTTNYLLET